MNIENQHAIKLKILDVKDNLPKKQKKLCDFILKNYPSLGLVTIKELSSEAEVGISTVMRTLKALGYDNFNDFKRDIYEETMPIESSWSLKQSFIDSADKNETLMNVWDKSVELLNKSYSEELNQNFKESVQYIRNSKNISIIGTRPYKSAALYLEQLLGEFYSNIRQLSHDTEIIYDKVLQMNKKDVLVVFAFEPYSKLVLNVAKVAQRTGVKILLITDYDSCPIVQYADVILKLAVSKNHFSILPIITLIDAIVLEIGKQEEDMAVEKLKKLETILQENDITYKIE